MSKRKVIIRNDNNPQKTSGAIAEFGLNRKRGSSIISDVFLGQVTLSKIIFRQMN